MRTKGGNTCFIEDILFVLGLAQNLLSVGQLIKKEYLEKFQGEKRKIMVKDKTLIANVKITPNKVFPHVMPLVENFSLKVDKIDESLLLHLSYKGLKLLKKKNMVIGLPKIDIENNICEEYVDQHEPHLFKTKNMLKVRTTK